MKVEEIDWNDALRDLFLLGELERQAILSYAEYNIKTYCTWLKAYFQKLCSMVTFDRSIYIEKFRQIHTMIWAENATADVLAHAFEDLENIYYSLSEIKVNAGLSVKPKVLKEVLRKREIDKKKRSTPILELE